MAKGPLFVWRRTLLSAAFDFSSRVTEPQVRSVSQRCYAPPAAPDSRLFRRQRGPPAFNGGERNSPKGRYLIILLGKFDRVSGDPLEGSQLCDDPSRDLSATLIPHGHRRAHQQLTMELDGRSMLVQVGGLGGHRKGILLAIFPRQPYGSVEGNSTAAPLRYLTAMSASGGH